MRVFADGACPRAGEGPAGNPDAANHLELLHDPPPLRNEGKERGHTRDATLRQPHPDGERAVTG